MINAEVYLFGNLGGGYTQYPDDYTSNIFGEFERALTTPTQLMIHRNEDVIYYAYLRRLSQHDNYIGICCAFNGVLCADPTRFCKLCEDNITNWVVNGDILEFADNGDIVSDVDKLYKVSSELKRISESLLIQINTLNLPFEKLPSINYAVNRNSVKKLLLGNGNDKINEALNDYSELYVYSDFVSESLKGFSDKLRKLNKENTDLKAENKKILQKKKQSDVVAVLVCILIILLLVAYAVFSGQKSEINSKSNTITSLANDKKHLEGALSVANRNLEAKENQLDEKREKIRQLSQQNVILENDIQTLQNEINNLQKENEKIRSLSNQGSTQSSYRTQSYAHHQTYTIGADISKTSNTYDNEFSLCLQASCPLIINSFKVKSQQGGYYIFGLYSNNGKLLSSHSQYLSGGITQINPNFVIDRAGKYCIKIISGGSLSFHASSHAEYGSYSQGPLEIIGSCRETNMNNLIQTYYQYFYNIRYTTK